MEGDRHHMESDFKALSEKFLMDRGWCCGNKCHHCVFEPKHVKGSSEIREEIIDKFTEGEE